MCRILLEYSSLPLASLHRVFAAPSAASEYFLGLPQLETQHWILWLDAERGCDPPPLQYLCLEVLLLKARRLRPNRFCTEYCTAAALEQFGNTQGSAQGDASTKDILSLCCHSVLQPGRSKISLVTTPEEY